MDKKKINPKKWVQVFTCTNCPHQRKHAVNTSPARSGAVNQPKQHNTHHNRIQFGCEWKRTWGGRPSGTVSGDTRSGCALLDTRRAVRCLGVPPRTGSVYHEMFSRKLARFRVHLEAGQRFRPQRRCMAVPLFGACCNQTSTVANARPTLTAVERCCTNTPETRGCCGVMLCVHRAGYSRNLNTWANRLEFLYKSRKNTKFNADATKPHNSTRRTKRMNQQC